MSMLIAAALVACPPAPSLRGCAEHYYQSSFINEAYSDNDKNYVIVVDELNPYVMYYPLKEKMSYVLSKFNKVDVGVDAFLLRNDSLISLLNEAIPVIRECFPKDALISARVLRNDVYGEKPQLYVSIQSDEKKMLFDELKSFDEHFGIDKLMETDLLIFGV